MVIGVPIGLMTAIFLSKLAPAPAVSYTHLDVYKRQTICWP